MEHRTCSPTEKAAVTALRDRLQSYCGQGSDLAQDFRTQDAMNALRARLLAFDLEHRARFKSCTADVLPEEETKDLRSDIIDTERYGISPVSSPYLDDNQHYKNATKPKYMRISQANIHSMASSSNLEHIHNENKSFKAELDLKQDMICTKVYLLIRLRAFPIEEDVAEETFTAQPLSLFFQNPTSPHTAFYLSYFPCSHQPPPHADVPPASLAQAAKSQLRCGLEEQEQPHGPPSSSTGARPPLSCSCLWLREVRPWARSSPAATGQRA
ncbi:hypothetical protein Droror1_Dr00002192 [Drosera rotundifolia]